MKIINTKKSGKYCFITFDDQRTYKILLDLSADNFLETGCEISEQEFQKIECENEFKMSLNSAFDILSRRLNSEFELRIKLKKKFWKTNIERVIDECKRLKLLDDDYFTECYIQELKNRGKGKFQIISSLKLKGISQEILDKYVMELGDENDEKERAFQLAESKIRLLKNLPQEKIKEKLCRFLLSKGFSYETVFCTVNKIINEQNSMLEKIL